MAQDSPTSHVTFPHGILFLPQRARGLTPRAQRQRSAAENVISPLMVGLSPKDGVSPKGRFLWAQAKAESLMFGLQFAKRQS